MKKSIYLFIILCAGLFQSCKKERELTVLKSVSFSSSLTANKSAVILSSATDTSSVVTFSWPAVSFPIKASVTYTLEVDVPADTVGAAAWSKATSVAVGNDVLSKSYKGKDLNDLALSMGIASGATGNLVFRVKAYQDRATYSKAVSLSVKTYQAQAVYPLLYIPGDYQGWSPSTAPTAAALLPKIYEAYIYIPAGGTNYFKMTSAKDWDHINYGDGGAGKISVDGNAAGLIAPASGYIQVSVNLNTNTWSATKTTWSILGDASPGGWSTDTQLVYNTATQVWTVTADMVSTGSFKFRANNAWTIDFGVDANGKLAYADSPVFGYNGTVNNITVPSSGNYTITLDLHDPSNYNYKLKKN
ncbi:SusF/SusE family outer membrane protein [Pedobacter frigidisoli]|uniref:SusF/SusE family outer membrane protein n=1 Tax=Pedobacter frigidisoli TaxID=2530455 RepID=A0A4R0P2R1_9SPHI|nr:SusE domain-containing protein [Pedobacter frigidisoli]TCD08298.1 SusF/SusE family outer membrane protein [Pedobacter frigidisoli]